MLLIIRLLCKTFRVDFLPLPTPVVRVRGSLAQHLSTPPLHSSHSTESIYLQSPFPSLDCGLLKAEPFLIHLLVLAVLDSVLGTQKVLNKYQVNEGLSPGLKAHTY